MRAPRDVGEPVTPGDSDLAAQQVQQPYQAEGHQRQQCERKIFKQACEMIVEGDLKEGAKVIVRARAGVTK